MSRASQGQPITVRPALNVYTVLSAVAVVASILALAILYTQAGNLLPAGLFG
jgi:hypothetical protein